MSGQPHKTRRGRWIGFLSLLLTAPLTVAGGPAIELTGVPPFGSFNQLAGRVLEANPVTHRVAVFIYVPSSGWWSKPYCNPQLTAIQPDGSWAADITTGGVDHLATKITALLVSSNYSEPCVEGPALLPANVLAQAIASATAERVDPAVRWISFSGYEWWVKNSPGLVGPGPNFFSSRTNNVWLDAAGRLHLRITYESNVWQCAEVVTRRTFGYGSYRFELDSAVDMLDPSVVLGLFTWSDDPAYTHREIDIECGRWANSYDTNNAQYVVQPWDAPGHLARYAVPAGITNSTHLFIWETNRVTGQSLRGGYSPNPAPANRISSWVFTNAPAVPQSGDENVRLNLWLIHGQPPTDSNEVEFVIKSFEFVPLGPPQPARLTNATFRPPDAIQFDIQGQMDRRYQIDTSTNALDWQALGVIHATNTITPFTETNLAARNARFYRARTLP